MAPGQEWRTHWDTASDRYNSGLPDRHEGTITYSGEKDVYKKHFCTTAILDWSIYKSRRLMVKYGVHDLALAVRKMSSNQQKWTEDGRGSLSVYTRSGHEKDDKLRQQHQEFLRQQEASSENAE